MKMKIYTLTTDFGLVRILELFFFYSFKKLNFTIVGQIENYFCQKAIIY